MISLMVLRSGLPGVALAACVMFASPVFAETISFKADLKASEEVPPNDSKATGTVTATYDTASKKLTWKGNYSGLTGPATMAHFHGPAEPGKNAGVAVPIAPSASPFENSANLTDAQPPTCSPGAGTSTSTLALTPAGKSAASSSRECERAGDGGAPR
jgi:CHRD domain